MGNRHDNTLGFWGLLAIGGGIAAAGAVFGIAYVPAYFSYRDVQQAVESTVRKAEPTMQDEQILAMLNGKLFDMNTSRYWVEDGVQRQQVGLEIPISGFKAERNGTQELTLKVDFTQQVLLHGLNKVVVVPYHCEAHAFKN